MFKDSQNISFLFRLQAVSDLLILRKKCANLATGASTGVKIGLSRRGKAWFALHRPQGKTLIPKPETKTLGHLPWLLGRHLCPRLPFDTGQRLNGLRGLQRRPIQADTLVREAGRVLETPNSRLVGDRVASPGRTPRHKPSHRPRNPMLWSATCRGGPGMQNEWLVDQ